jgi:hypothetical protein
MNLEFEKVMWPSLFLGKKAYAYMKYDGGKPKQTSMGLLNKKRGTCSLFKTAYETILQIYLTPPDWFSLEELRTIVLRVMRDLLRELQLAPPEAFVQTALLKPEDAYNPTQKLAHVCAARRLVAQTGCAWPAGQRIQYLLAKPPNSVSRTTYTKSDHTYALESFKQDHLVVDIAQYLGTVRGRYQTLLTPLISDSQKRFDDLLQAFDRGSLDAKQRRLFASTAPPPPPSSSIFRHDTKMFNYEAWRAYMNEESDDVAVNEPSGAYFFRSIITTTTPARAVEATSKRAQSTLDTNEASELRKSNKMRRVAEESSRIAQLKRGEAINKPLSERKKEEKKLKKLVATNSNVTLKSFFS